MLLHFGDKDYPVDKLVFFSTICPTAEVESKDMIVNDNTVVTKSKHIVVYPHDNKYLVLIKPDTIDSFKTKVAVKIMGKMVLKKITHAVEEAKELSRTSPKRNTSWQPNRREFR